MASCRQGPLAVRSVQSAAGPAERCAGTIDACSFDFEPEKE
ncbi:hypothetical protein [Paenibacillus dendritiformis]|nr:hypothetical protein [Paenibacillus dendritiformis]